jgi:hypothetical protein
MGASHLSGPLTVAQGIATGGVFARSLATTSSGPMFSVALSRSVSTHVAASGAILDNWVFAPSRNIAIREIAILFGTAAQGGNFGIKMFGFSAAVGTLTSKGVVNTSVAGGRKVIRFTGLSVTCNTGRAFGIAVSAVGSTAPGRGGKVTLHYTYQ